MCNICTILSCWLCGSLGKLRLRYLGFEVNRMVLKSWLTGGPSAPIKPRAPLSVPRIQPKVSRREQKDDDQLFEFLNSSAQPSKDKRPTKTRVGQDTEGVAAQTSDAPKQNKPMDRADGGSGSAGSQLWFFSDLAWEASVFITMHNILFMVTGLCMVRSKEDWGIRF